MTFAKHIQRTHVNKNSLWHHDMKILPQGPFIKTTCRIRCSLRFVSISFSFIPLLKAVMSCMSLMPGTLFMVQKWHSQFQSVFHKLTLHKSQPASSKFHGAIRFSCIHIPRYFHLTCHLIRVICSVKYYCTHQCTAVQAVCGMSSKPDRRRVCCGRWRRSQARTGVSFTCPGFFLHH